MFCSLSLLLFSFFFVALYSPDSKTVQTQKDRLRLKNITQIAEPPVATHLPTVVTGTQMQLEFCTLVLIIFLLFYTIVIYIIYINTIKLLLLRVFLFHFVYFVSFSLTFSLVLLSPDSWKL